MSWHDYIEPCLQITIADRVLKEIFTIAKQLEIKAFLAFGTCLGFVRDGGYIEGDLDLDVGVICEWEKKDALKNSFEVNGFILKRSKPHDKHIIYRKGKVLIDIWFRTKSGRFYSEFDYVLYKRKQYPVPHPVEEYLNTCYSNWKAKEDQKTQYRG